MSARLPFSEVIAALQNAPSDVARAMIVWGRPYGVEWELALAEFPQYAEGWLSWLLARMLERGTLTATQLILSSVRCARLAVDRIPPADGAQAHRALEVASALARGTASREDVYAAMGALRGGELAGRRPLAHVAAYHAATLAWEESPVARAMLAVTVAAAVDQVVRGSRTGTTATAVEHFGPVLLRGFAEVSPATRPVRAEGEVLTVDEVRGLLAEIDTSTLCYPWCPGPDRADSCRRCEDRDDARKHLAEYAEPIARLALTLAARLAALEGHDG